MTLRTPCLILLIIKVLFLSGCVQKNEIRKGKAVVLVPIERIWSVSVYESNFKEVKQQLIAIMLQNKAQIMRQGLVISFCPEAGFLVNELQQILSDQGVPNSKITLDTHPLSMDVDITFSLTDWVVNTDSCSFTLVGNYRNDQIGCYVNNLRWKSMVSPEVQLGAGKLERIHVKPDK